MYSFLRESKIASPNDVYWIRYTNDFCSFELLYIYIFFLFSERKYVFFIDVTKREKVQKVPEIEKYKARIIKLQRQNENLLIKA